MTLTLEGTILVPVADPDDSEQTARMLVPYLGAGSTVVVVNVIEKAGGAVDKAPMERREEYAEEMYRRARTGLADSPATVETETLYGTDVVDRIFSEARERNADAVAFTPREGNRFVELLTGDVARKLVKKASIPVVALPHAAD